MTKSKIVKYLCMSFLKGRTITMERKEAFQPVTLIINPDSAKKILEGQNPSQLKLDIKERGPSWKHYRFIMVSPDGNHYSAWYNDGIWP